MPGITQRASLLRLSVLVGAGFAAGLVVGIGAIPLAQSRDSQSSSVEARLERLEAEQDIRDVIMEYGHTFDLKDLVAFSKLFAKDGEWIGGFGRAKGPEAILALMQSKVGTAPADPTNVRGFHVFTNPIIHVNGDHATSLCKLIFMARDKENHPAPVLGGHYDDTFVREDGHWKFLRRVVMLDIPYQDPRDEEQVKNSKPPI
jgi:hypothetical protein